jgi:hypothetical protein
MTKMKTRQSLMNKKCNTEIRDWPAKSDLAPPNQTSKNTQHTQAVNQNFPLKSSKITTDAQRSPSSVPLLIIGMKSSSWLTLYSKKCKMKL